MQFRTDINGLRAFAVIAVVLYHFNANLLPGGFAGVDVFFVISGFLMTGIIFRGIEHENFSIWDFYIARANRIIPALTVLCFVTLLVGIFILPPLEFKTLAKHVASSAGFLSNFVYWSESGYFDSVSHGKWLLHTWSLSTEWQFYIVYPVLLVILRKFMSCASVKLMVLIGTVVGFVFCVIATYKFNNFSYYLLPTRAWEMLIGGVAYLFPFRIKNENKRLLELLGIVLVISSYLLISKETPWPGYIAMFPVLGAFLIIQAQRDNSIFTGNFVSQKIGKWSYSIYLWHWPFVVAIYYFALSDIFIYIGIFSSLLCGFLSYQFIEGIKFKKKDGLINICLKSPTLYMSLVIGILGSIVFVNDGFIKQSPVQYQYLISNLKSSPFRDKCHIEEYQDPALSCEYFGSKVSWATLGDSHSAEIAYVLAQKLKNEGVGLKQFSFSGCKPSYKEPDDFSKCAKWYNDSVEYILNNNNLKNVVFNHRFTNQLFGGGAYAYPETEPQEITEEVIRIMKNMDELIYSLATKKDHIYIFYPFPELQRDISQLIGKALINEDSLMNIIGTDYKWYSERNRYIIDHMNKSNYPSNVHLLKSQNVFCDEKDCYAVKDGIPLYFDNDHPSLLGAGKLIELMNLNK